MDFRGTLPFLGKTAVYHGVRLEIPGFRYGRQATHSLPLGAGPERAAHEMKREGRVGAGFREP
jgi:hypothetical protein